MRTRRVCALLGIDSGIGGATKDSNFSSIQLSVLDENELSNCINRGLEHWFQSYFQGCSSQRYIYNDCFPKCEIPEWFCHQSGSLLRIQLIPNLYTNSDWIGIALFATFTMHKHPTLILDNLATEISHGFSCSLRSQVTWAAGRYKLNCSNLLTALFGSDSQDLMVQNCGYSLVYQQNVGELVQTLVQCSTMFSDNSDLIYQFTAHQSRTKQQSHDDDNVEGETSGTGGSNGTLRGLQEKIKQPSHDYDQDDEDEGETSGTGRSNGTLRVPHYQEKDFHLHYPYDCCFDPTKIPELFSHYASGSSMAIQLTSNLHNDSNWLGFAICAAFSVQEYPTDFLDNLETEIPHHLSCLFDMDIGDKINQCNHIEVSIASDWPGWIVQKCGLRLVESSFVHEHPTITSDNLDSDITHHLICHLDAEKGIHLAILHTSWELSDFFNQSSQIGVSIGSDFPGLMVKKCGQRFLYHQDVEEFEQTIIKWSTVPFYIMELIHQSVASDSPNDKPKNEAGCSYEDPNIGRLRRPIYPEQSSRDSIYLEDQNPDNQLSKSDLQEFDRSLVYNSCFPPSEILEWFNHRSGKPPVTIHLPPNLYDDSTWRGLALCVSFSVNIKDPTAILDILNSENAHHLYCHLESNVGSLEPLHAYCLTKDDVMLLHLGGFMWLSYIPHSSFPDWSNQCNHIDASIVSNCPDLTVKCGLRLVHQHDEEEFVFFFFFAE
uniref:C-JID domain-containing protein n=1 Tax=Quercus lobata TaxID=97700 RepID=A0A7N2LAG3_QUELO